MSVLITGSAKGLGLELGKLFLSDQEFVFFHSRSPKDNFLLEKFRSDQYSMFSADLAEENQVSVLLNDIYQHDAKPSLIICNAGKSSFQQNSHLSHISWEQAFNDNFYSVLNIVNKAPSIKEKYGLKRLNIVCISSICGIDFIKGAPLQYSVAKSALNTLVKFYSKDLIRQDISLNAIAAGNIIYPGSQWETKFKNKSDQQKYLESIPSSKFITVDEIYKLIRFLSQEGNSFVGEVFVLDGGQSNRSQ
jgi:NAD(P)-dependent dehydrogenase (short-subunit alcohol dehydrogenase family)